MLGAIVLGKRRTSLFQKGLRIHLLVMDLWQEGFKSAGRDDPGYRDEGDALVDGRVLAAKAQRRGRAGQVQRPFVMEAISSWQPFHLLAGDRTHYLWRLSSLSSGMKGAIAAENRGE